MLKKNIFMVFVFCVLTSGVFADYLNLQMDEGGGTTVFDSSGNGNNGTIIDQDMPGTWDWSTDTHTGSGYSVFSNEHDMIKVDNDPSITFTGAFEISAWVKPVGDVVMYGPREGFSHAMGIVGKGRNNGGIHEGYGMYIANNGILHGIIGFENAGVIDFASTGNLDGTVVHSQWNHVEIWFDGVDTYGLRLNGVELNIDGGSKLSATDSVRASSRPLFIGVDEWNGQYVNGYIDDVVIVPEPATVVLLALGAMALGIKQTGL